MIITSEIMYHKFVEKVQSEIDSIKGELSKLKGTRSYLIGKLEDGKEIIEKYTGKSFEEAITLKSIKGVKFKDNHLDFVNINRNRESDVNYLTGILTNLITTNSLISNKQNKLEEISRTKVKEEVYKALLRYMNKRMVERMITGYVFSPGYGISNLGVKKQKRLRPVIDWGASNTYKAELIKEGKVPYDKEKAPDGVKWHQYHVEDFYAKWHWKKGCCCIHNHDVYSFNPTVGPRGITRKLHQAVKANPQLLNKYTL